MNVSAIIRRAALAAMNEVVQRTPVKTGLARINWRMSFGGPKSSMIKPPDTPNRETNRRVATTQALINGSNMIKGWRVGKGNIFIANPVHYISELDSGTSEQARAGMTAFAIAAARDILRKGRLLKRGG